MPFTFAHPALAIPLKKINASFSLTGLIVGSMVPDFENFFQLNESSHIGHHMPGILLLDIPMGLLVCFLFHHFIKWYFINNLPDWLRNRFQQYLSFQWSGFSIKQSAMLLLSLLTGTLLHLFWDGFTHDDGIFVLLFPILSMEIHLFQLSIPIHFLLQIVSSLLGIWVLYKMIAYLPVQKDARLYLKSNTYYWPSIASIVCSILLLRIYCWPAHNTKLSLIKASIGAGMYALIIVSILYTYYFKKPIGSKFE